MTHIESVVNRSFSRLAQMQADHIPQHCLITETQARQILRLSDSDFQVMTDTGILPFQHRQARRVFDLADLIDLIEWAATINREAQTERMAA